MNFGNLEDLVEEVVMSTEDPATIAAEVSKVLDALKREDIFLVRRLAIDIAAAIMCEQAFNDGDMIEVIRKQAPYWSRR